MKRAGTNLRYFQKTTDALPKLKIRVDVLPLAEGDKPVGFAVLDNRQVVGTLTLQDLADAMARYEKQALPA
jgi:hypothetical protein